MALLSSPPRMQFSKAAACFCSRTSTTTTISMIRHTHYQTLGVSHNATMADIKVSFLKLSKTSHPDTNTADPTLHEKFVKINEAYSVLSNRRLRNDYDLELVGAQHRNGDKFYEGSVHWDGAGGQTHYRKPRAEAVTPSRHLFRKFTLTLRVILLLSFILHDVIRKRGLAKNNVKS